MKRAGVLIGFGVLCLIRLHSQNNFISQSSTKLVFQSGIDIDRISRAWTKAIAPRMSVEMLDSINHIQRSLNAEEQGWQTLIQSKINYWNSILDSLALPFHNYRPPDTVIILSGYTGSDDAFTYEYNTVCLDLTALYTNYGSYKLGENEERITRLFNHEFTHLLHKEWARKNELVLTSFKDSVLWECLYEGWGMYRSLSKKWLPVNGTLPAVTENALHYLYPDFVDHLTKAFNPELDNLDKSIIYKNLSRGPVDKKWGAFTVAIWLALESSGNGEDLEKLSYCIDQGLVTIYRLALKYLPEKELNAFKIGMKKYNITFKG